MAARVLVLALALGGCFIDRKSEELRCDTTLDCMPGRTCVNNYCIGGNPILDAQCPAQCASCNAATMSCTIAGSGADVMCPFGWNCTINCNAPDACHNISCPTGSCTVACSASTACRAITCQTGNCNVMCTAPGACGDITCGIGRCTVACASAGACGDINCAASCACDVNCPTGNCGTNTCPSNGANQCTTTGNAGAPCLSSAMSNCSRC